MLTNKQKALIKTAQRDAGLSDAEYREAWQLLSGQLSVVSSTDPRLSDEHFDTFMSYLEAIYWGNVGQASRLSPPARASKVFARRNYWSRKNTRAETSRDRYTRAQLV